MNCSGSILTLLFLPTVSGDDFVPDPTLNVTFSATPSGNPTDECVSIVIEDDSDIECDHNFTVGVGAIVCDVNPPITSASPFTTVTIKDNDGILYSFSHNNVDITIYFVFFSGRCYV